MMAEGTDFNVGDVVQVTQREKRGSGRKMEGRMWVLGEREGGK